MGLDDRDALSVLRDAVNPVRDSDELIAAFYTRWFAIDDSVRDMFPPDMTAQRAMFNRALDWLLGEFVAQRAEEPVAFLAQLGRDHRKYGVTGTHYESMSRALYATLRNHLGDRWSPAVDEAAGQMLNLIDRCHERSGRRRAGPGVVGGHRRRASPGVPGPGRGSPLPRSADGLPARAVRQGRSPATASGAGATCHRRFRRNPTAASSSTSGSVSGGMVSTAIVEETRPGDRWRLSSPHGAMEVDRDAGDVLMVAGSTGLSPLRAIIMDMARFGVNPRVHLFFGARYPCELYDLRTLWEIAANNPWLSVTPVSEYNTDPPWAADYPMCSRRADCTFARQGLLPDVVTRYGGWGDRQILISGGPAMVRATRAALIAKGAPAERIQHDPISG